MKVLQVAPYYYPTLGGVEEVVRQYSEGLAKRGHKVSVLTSTRSGKRTLNGVEIESFRELPIKGVFSPFVPSLPLRLLNLEADILHLHANKRFTTDSSSFINLFKKVPMVFNPHAGQFGSSFLGRIHNLTIGRLSFAADLVLAVSEFEKNLILSAGMRPKRIEVLFNGVNSLDFKKERKNVFENFDIGERKIILFVGRLGFNKDLPTLLRALKSVKESVLFLIGPDAGERANLDLLVKELNLEERVFILGALDREEVISAYQHSDIFCLPSINEAFGLVILESMASGLPVIASDLSATKEIIEDGKNGLLFKVGDFSDLADKVNILLGDSKLRKRFSEEGKKTVEEKYEWEKIVGSLEKLYQEIQK